MIVLGDAGGHFGFFARTVADFLRFTDPTALRLRHLVISFLHSFILSYNISMEIDEFDNFILENFGGVICDNPWEKEPDFTVFRHTDNRKWFALRFYATREQLLKLKPEDAITKSYAAGEKIDMINIKIDPELVEIVTKEPGFLPAFHMSRRHWITILLDKEVNVARMKPLIEMSYNLTMKKRAAKKS